MVGPIIRETLLSGCLSYEPDIPQSTNARVGRVGRRASQISKVVNIDQIFGEEVCILLAQAASVISKTKWK